MKKIFKIDGDGENPDFYLRKYNYCSELTKKLDDMGKDSFSQDTINEIILWKVNRYAFLDSDTIDELNGLINLSPGEHRKVGGILERLLVIKGIDLAVASTILRFRNPKVFQIIDQRAYRVVYGELPAVGGKAGNMRYGRNDKEKMNTYFKYLDDLIGLCNSNNIRFESADRILYEYDRYNNKGKIRY